MLKWSHKIPSKKKYKERKRKGAPLIMSRSSKTELRFSNNGGSAVSCTYAIEVHRTEWFAVHRFYSSFGVPLLLFFWRILLKTEGTRRILHKRRKWGEPSVFGGRKEYSTWGVTAKLSSKGIPPEFRFWLTQQEEEMRRILHFRWIKRVLLLRRTRGKQSRFSWWAVFRIVYRWIRLRNLSVSPSVKRL